MANEQEMQNAELERESTLIPPVKHVTVEDLAKRLDAIEGVEHKGDPNNVFHQRNIQLHEKHGDSRATFLEKLELSGIITQDNMAFFLELLAEYDKSPNDGPEIFTGNGDAFSGDKPVYAEDNLDGSGSWKYGSGSWKYGGGDWTSVPGEGLSYPGEGEEAGTATAVTDGYVPDETAPESPASDSQEEVL